MRYTLHCLSGAHGAAVWCCAQMAGPALQRSSTTCSAPFFTRAAPVSVNCALKLLSRDVSLICSRAAVQQPRPPLTEGLRFAAKAPTRRAQISSLCQSGEHDPLARHSLTLATRLYNLRQQRTQRGPFPGSSLPPVPRACSQVRLPRDVSDGCRSLRCTVTGDDGRV